MEAVLKLLLVLVLALLLLLEDCNGLEIAYEDQLSSYRILQDGQEVLGDSAPISLYACHQWFQQGHNLHPIKSNNIQGSGNFGDYAGYEVQWNAAGCRSHGGKPTVLVTRVKNYDTRSDAEFEYTFPNGAVGTSSGDTADDVILEFPALRSHALPDKLSFQGSFVQLVRDFSYGTTGGPVLFYDASDSLLQRVVVAGPTAHFKASSAGSKQLHNSSQHAYNPGVSIKIRELPPEFSYSVLFHTSKAGGIWNTLLSFGTLLQTHYRTYRLYDVTLDRIGYQTDNGASYCFCGHNCSDTLIKEMESLRSISPGYLSFQGAGASRSTNSAPWCVKQWGVHQGLGGNFPVPVKALHDAIQLPLQLYTPYFCTDNVYFNSSSRWKAVSSNTSLPGCTNYGFQNVVPEQSEEFYSWYFASGVNAGMVSFEPDFINQNYNCINQFINDVHSFKTWQDGMANAALKRNVTIQYCYATPFDVMSALDMPALTNFRGSFDFCYGSSYAIGGSSLLIAAFGLAPSKDTLWTSINSRLEVPGCRWRPDHEQDGVYLHNVIALMSTGPVGISDLLKHTDTELVTRMVNADGVLLQPTQPVTSIDATFLKGAGAVPGEVYRTYSSFATLPLRPNAYYLLSFKLKAAWTARRSDLYPPAQPDEMFVVATFVQQQRMRQQHNGTVLDLASSGVASFVGSRAQQVALLPRSDYSNVTAGTELRPVLTTVWPVTCSTVLLGELGKYVPLSGKRFDSCDCSQGSIRFRLKGKAREKVMVSLLVNQGALRYRLLHLEAEIQPSGSTLMVLAIPSSLKAAIG